ncbi:Asparaginase/glutaminase [Jimgerdemannia flammicorona]|uniref:asparaginase n=1 Tax=Jimgerdemannia flammicorona TaxID=994334 RepID=A0A433D895_9FUNG|nr:Asparaginase/glutaminase [Jimgerdemannia flammicorona]
MADPQRHPFSPHGLKDVPSPSINRPPTSFQYTSIRTDSPIPPDSEQIYASSAVRFQLSADRDDMLAPDISCVLVIYTGGTIGMKNTRQHGYVPVHNYLAKTLANMGRFHDPEGISDYNAPTSTKEPELRPPYPGADDGHVPPVDPSVNKVRLTENMKKGKWQTIGKDEGDNIKQVPSLITPMSMYGKRIRYSILEYDPLLDSCNMTMSDWIRIATDIEANYQFYDAFIILHGTDTMAYTASALSFMLEELGKTVIITGSQVPITEIRNDAVENLLGALIIAGHFVIPEVCLYFSQRLFRGNRTSKISAVDFEAFDSPNLRPLVTAGINIGGRVASRLRSNLCSKTTLILSPSSPFSSSSDVAWSEIVRPTAIAKFRAHKQMNPNVATLRLFPGILESTIRAFLAPPIQGIVLETYGAGNAPSARLDLIAALEEASARGVIIVNCTQCKKGLVTDSYATGKVLHNAGIIPGADMTPEVCVW